jgi:AcrR family transcriptional regulator
MSLIVIVNGVCQTTMRTKKTQQRGPAEHARRDQIVAAADDLFRRCGYEKTTVSDLAKAVGFSTSYVYKFFDSKQAIGETICGIWLSRIAADLHAATRRSAAASQVLGRLFQILSQHARDLSLHESKLQEMVLAAHREHWRCFEKHKSALRSVIMRVVEEGRRAGEFDRETPIEETCQSIMLVMESFWNPAFWAEKLGHFDEQATALAALVLRGTRPQR